MMCAMGRKDRDEAANIALKVPPIYCVDLNAFSSVASACAR